MDFNPVVFLPIFINRLTEVVKKTFVDNLPATDEVKSALILFLSLLLGVLGVVFLFPSINFLAGKGASLLAEQVVSGVIIGGLANGIDFLASAGTGVLNNIITPTATTATVIASPSLVTVNTASEPAATP